jgi:ABC-type amino acid transport substrate-binding protein
MALQHALGGSVLAALAVLLLACGTVAQARNAPHCPPAAEAAGRGVDAALGRPLKVGVHHAPPLAMEGERGGWQGMAVDLWEQVALCLGTRHEYVEFATVADLLEATEQGAVDLALGALPITSRAEQRLDFTHAFHTGSLGVAVREASPWRGLLDELGAYARWEVAAGLLTLAAAALLVAHLFWRSEQRLATPLFTEGPGRGLYHALLWAVQLVFAGKGDPLDVRHRAGQLGVLLLAFLGATVAAAVSAVLTSALTLTGIERRVQTVADLKQREVAVMTSGPAAGWAGGERVFVLQLRSWPEAQRRLDEREIDALLHDRDFLQYLVNDGYLRNVRIDPLAVRPQPYGLAVPQGSALRSPVNDTLLALQEDALWPLLREKYLGAR